MTEIENYIISLLEEKIEFNEFQEIAFPILQSQWNNEENKSDDDVNEYLIKIYEEKYGKINKINKKKNKNKNKNKKKINNNNNNDSNDNILLSNKINDIDENKYKVIENDTIDNENKILSKKEKRKLKKKKKKNKNKNNDNNNNNNNNNDTWDEGLGELEDTDDWSSAWKDVRENGETWGGRGKGGRGIQRNTWQPNDVSVEGVTLSFIGKEILSRTKIHLVNGHRYGLIGNNGVGKSTLLRRMNAKEIPGWPLHLSTYLVGQEVDYNDDKIVLNVVIDSDIKKQKIMDEIDELTLKNENNEGNIIEQLEKINKLYEELSLYDIEQIDYRAKNILKNLGFTDNMIENPASNLSGGWRIRLNIACALFIKPDILLLDEVNNHLDLEGIIWLQNFLTTEFESIIVLVSHDRIFLDTVCTDIIEFRNKKLKYYPGDFSSFIKTKENDTLKMHRIQEGIDRKRKQLKESIKKMEKQAKGLDNKRLNLIATKKKKLSRVGYEKNINGHRWRAQTEFSKVGAIGREGSLNENALGFSKAGKFRARSLAERPDPEFIFQFPEPLPLNSNKFIKLTNISFGYDDNNILFRNINLSIEKNSRICLIGPNGCGKSTLLKLIAGELTPKSGTIEMNRKIRIGYFNQHHQDNMILTDTPIEHLLNIYTESNESLIRAHLGKFGIRGHLATQPLRTLSGGQKSRVVFAELTYLKPDILLLDEPSNHLDYMTINGLKYAFQDYKGAIILITHDQQLLKDFQTNNNNNEENQEHLINETEYYLISKKNRNLKKLDSLDRYLNYLHRNYVKS